MVFLEQDGMAEAERVSHLHTVSDLAGQGMLVADTDLRVIAINERLKRLLAEAGMPSPVGLPLDRVLEMFPGGKGGAALVRAGRPAGPSRLLIADNMQEMRGAAVPGLGYLLVFRDIRACSVPDRVTGPAPAPAPVIAPAPDGGEIDAVHEALESSPVGACIVGPDGLFRYANPKLHQMLGFDAGRLGGTDALARYADPQARSHLLQEMERAGAVVNFETVLVRRDDSTLTALISARRFHHGGAACMLGWVRAIADNAAFEGELVRSNTELELQILELRDREDRMAEQAAELEWLAVRLAESERKMAELANYDMLTGLPTLRLCQERLKLSMAYAKRHGTLTALFYIDLDGFKTVNDTFGHDAGNTVLKEAATRMSRCLREVDMVARIGGDEFLVVLGDLGYREAVISLAGRLLDCFPEPFILPEGEARIGASIGIAFYDGGPDAPEALVKRADRAMYVAKKAGKNRYSIAAE